MKKFVPLLGRIFLAALFIMSSLGEAANFSATEGYMASNGIPASATSVLLVLALILKIAGGISVVLGYKVKWGVIALVVFLIPTTLIFHTDFADQNQIAHFLKNLSILGGLVILGYFGPGPLSLDNRARGASML